MPSLVEKLLQQLSSKQKIVVNVYDTTNSSYPMRMYGPNATDTGLLHVSHLDFGDPLRKHEMHCRYSFPSAAKYKCLPSVVYGCALGEIMNRSASLFYSDLRSVEHTSNGISQKILKRYPDKN